MNTMTFSLLKVSDVTRRACSQIVKIDCEVPEGLSMMKL